MIRYTKAQLAQLMHKTPTKPEPPVIVTPHKKTRGSPEKPKAPRYVDRASWPHTLCHMTSLDHTWDASIPTADYERIRQDLPATEPVIFETPGMMVALTDIEEISNV